MKIIDKYTIRNILPLIFISFLLFLVLFILIDIFGRLDEIIRAKVPVEIVFKYYINQIPYVFVRIIPFCILISTLYGFSIMNKEGEIGAMLACGISRFRIALPVVIISMVLSFVSFFISEFIAPQTYSRALAIKKIYFEEKQQKKPTTINNLTKHISRKKMLFAESYDIYSETLYNVIITEYTDEDILSKKTVVQSAKWENNIWKAKGVSIFQYLPTYEEPVVAGEMDLSLEISPGKLLEPEFNPEVASIPQFREYLYSISRNPHRTPRRLVVNFYTKYSIPFANFILVVMACSVAVVSRKIGALQGIGIGIVIGILFYIMFALSIAMGKGGYINPILSAFLVNFLFLVIGAVFFVQK